MKCLRVLLPLGLVALTGGCAVAPPPTTAIVSPGSGKDATAFQQDNLVCLQHAVGQTGYGAGAVPADEAASGGPGYAAPSPAAGPVGAAPSVAAGSAQAAGLTPISVGPWQPNEVGYMQCMAARGDVIQPAPTSYAGYGYSYAYPAYPYGYPYAWPYAYPGWVGGWYGGGWYGGGWGWGGGWRGGWGRGGWGGGWGHGGFGGRGGFGGGHGGGGHGGGGHR